MHYKIQASLWKNNVFGCLEVVAYFGKTSVETFVPFPRKSSKTHIGTSQVCTGNFASVNLRDTVSGHLVYGGAKFCRSYPLPSQILPKTTHSPLPLYPKTTYCWLALLEHQ